MGFFKKMKIKKDDERKSDDEQSKNLEVVDKKEDKEVSVKKTVVKKAKRNVTGKTIHVLTRPLISEKAAIAEATGVYTFVIKKDVSKIDIKNAIKEIYGVEPKKVRVINVEGKVKRSGRSQGRRTDWKKAVITLPKGQSISIHEGV